MDNKHLFGSHGTCRSYADLIVRDKKFNFAAGRHGSGAYLWQAHNQNEWDYAKKLAIAFAENNKDKFEKENDSSICWLKCSLSVNENKFYDLVCHEHCNFFQKYLTKACEKLGDNIKKYEWTKIYNAFFSLIKESTGIDIDVYFVLAESPFIREHEKLYITTNKASGCYVVRNNDVFTQIERCIV